MFTLKKKEPVVLTLIEVVQKYTSQNNDVLDNDFTEINNEIQKITKIIKFLEEEKSQAYDNEKEIYDIKINENTKKLKELNLQKSRRIQQIEAKTIKYQKIDLSFLSMKRPGKILPYHPIFSFHKYIENNFIDCKIWIGPEPFLQHYEVEIKNENHIASFIIFKQILKALTSNTDIDINKFSIGTYHEGQYFHNAIYEIKNNFTLKHMDSIMISTKFQGLIPEKTKQKIKEAKKIFKEYDNSGIFLIKECKNWNEQVITIDPLIIGVIGDQAYLIDCFDCTDIEEYVKTEFTG